MPYGGSIKKNINDDPIKKKEKKEKNYRKERIQKLQCLNESVKKGIKQNSSLI